ncbi:hypothetical protein DPMN_091678 [Dreissena polymorpha]|uniref:Uncharacterized protein n=1 Tax=Dreissena polymorpha TaxID=45954 RepID=A0A9D4L212_DREPO|nr:hypothetical protein DPMN_091678 [Dreissena polymorpha]
MSGPGRNRVEIEKNIGRSNARLSPGDRPTSDSLYVYLDELRPASVSHRSEALRQSDGHRPMYMSLGNTLTLADTRTMNPMSGDRRAIT